MKTCADYIKGCKNLKEYFRNNLEIVALKVKVECTDTENNLDYFLISRYDADINKIGEYGAPFYIIDLLDRRGHAYINFVNGKIDILEDPEITNKEYEVVIVDILPLKKVELTTEELYYVFDREPISNTVFDDTDAFQKFYGLKEEDTMAGFISDDKMQMKFGHIQEEFDELKRAYAEGNLVEAGDAIIDLIYVASGLGNLMNLPMNALWRDVQNSNMVGKERVTSLNNATKRGTTFDVRKTKEWIGPRGKEIIEEHNKQFED